VYSVATEAGQLGNPRIVLPAVSRCPNAFGGLAVPWLADVVSCFSAGFGIATTRHAHGMHLL